MRERALKAPLNALPILPEDARNESRLQRSILDALFS